MRTVDRLDSWAARHKIIATLVSAAIIVGCLMLAHAVDESDTAALRLQMLSHMSKGSV